MERIVERTVLGGVGPLVKHLAGSTAGPVAQRRGCTGREDAAVSMVGEIAGGTAMNQTFSDVCMRVTGVQGLPDQSSPRTVVASSGQHLLDGLARGRRLLNLKHDF